MAVHSLGCAAPALRKGAFESDHGKAGPAHPGGARCDPMTPGKLVAPQAKETTMLTEMKTAKPKVVNGINVDDSFALIEGVKRDAANGKTNWRVTTSWQGQTR